MNRVKIGFICNITNKSDTYGCIDKYGCII